MNCRCKMQMEEKDLITQFLALALMYIHEEKSIEFYAGRMNIESEKLNGLLYDASKREFVEWIEWLNSRI